MVYSVPGCRQGKFQVLQYNSNVKIVSLTVEVTNVPSPGKLAEDAHQATLNVTIPDALRYSAVRSPVRPLEGVLCKDDFIIQTSYIIHFSSKIYKNPVFRTMMSNVGLMVQCYVTWEIL